jgi:hypothetical protein
MQNFNWPSIWSAVAATTSAISAIILLMIHLKNRRDSVRPEIIPDGRSFEPYKANRWAEIRITGVRNIGKGPATFIAGEAKLPGVKPIAPCQYRIK